MNKIIIFFASMLVVLQFGCSVSSDSPVPPVDIPNLNSGADNSGEETQPTFSGLWKSLCLKNNEPNSLSLQVDISFSSSDLVVTTQRYLDSDCAVGGDKTVEEGVYTLAKSNESEENVIQLKIKIDDTASQKFWIKTKKVKNSLMISYFKGSEDDVASAETTIELLRLVDWDIAQTEDNSHLPEKSSKLEEGTYQMTSNEDCKTELKLGKPKEDYQDVYFKLPAACGGGQWVFTCNESETRCSGKGNWNLYQKSATQFYIEEAFDNKPYTFIKISE